MAQTENNLLSNKIEAKDTNITDLLKGKKFFIDYFQREYRWQESHMTLLIEDLTSTFLKSYDSDHPRWEVGKYKNYYLGPVVFSHNDGMQSIIDGQQRITSITLLLIYLNHRQRSIDDKVSIDELIYSEKFGRKSFNMTDEARQSCLTGLYEKGEYVPTDSDDETIYNMVERYNDIDQAFPEVIDDHALPYFIDWLVELVVIVRIKAYSEENAYTIFETMNDRGLNLTPSEMLKGYVLSRVTDKAQRLKVNEKWKESVQKLHEISDTADQKFFQAWFRAKYAITFRPSRSGSEDQDFELIGSRFHSWFKDNHSQRFQLLSSDDFYQFFSVEFPFFVDLYVKINTEKKAATSNCPHLNYVHYWGIAESLQDPLLMASINRNDDQETVNKKVDFVSRYIETYTVRRSVNYKKFGQSTIKYTMFNVVKNIRNNDLNELAIQLVAEIDSIEEDWQAFGELRMHGQNKKFIKHLLCRMTSYLDTCIGKDSNYIQYRNPQGRQYEIEHIWNDDFKDYKELFNQENDFNTFRNRIGGLLLLPNGTNQSYGRHQYEEKVNHYIKENSLAQTLHPKYYERNPNFLNSKVVKDVNFAPRTTFTKEDLNRRQDEYQRLAESIWSTDYFLTATISGR